LTVTTQKESWTQLNESRTKAAGLIECRLKCGLVGGPMNRVLSVDSNPPQEETLLGERWEIL